jgi:hypothetical protein
MKFRSRTRNEIPPKKTPLGDRLAGVLWEGKGCYPIPYMRFLICVYLYRGNYLLYLWISSYKFCHYRIAAVNLPIALPPPASIIFRS